MRRVYNNIIVHRYLLIIAIMGVHCTCDRNSTTVYTVPLNSIYFCIVFTVEWLFNVQHPYCILKYSVNFCVLYTIHALILFKTWLHITFLWKKNSICCNYTALNLKQHNPPFLISRSEEYESQFKNTVLIYLRYVVNQYILWYYVFCICIVTFYFIKHQAIIKQTRDKTMRKESGEVS